jgi:GR25 family glycosyltransferase involved in LPS biosynthesis
MQCFVINLDRDTERWEALHGALTRVGIAHQRFSAIDGRKVGAEYDHLLAPGTRTLTPRGVLGSALSHYLVLEAFLETSYETCLVLEDDALLDDACMEHLAKIRAAAPPGWDMIKLASFLHTYTGPKVLKPFTTTIDFVARLVSRAGAQKLLAQRIAYPGYADITSWFVPHFNTYIVNSRYRTFYQTWSASNNAGKRYPAYELNLPVVRLGPGEVLTGDVIAALVLLVGVTVALRR